MSLAFWKRMCTLRLFFRITFYLSVVFITITVIPLLFINRNTPSYYISVVVLIMNVSVFIPSLYIIRRCAKRHSIE